MENYDLNFNHYLHGGFGHSLLRSWQEEHPLEVSQLMYPIFVLDSAEGKENEEEKIKNEIKALPEQYQLSVDMLEGFLKPLVEKGLRSVIVFGVLTKTKKDPHAECALGEKSPVYRAVKLLRKLFPDLYIACDVCLCGYTDHGHCGVLHDDGSIDNPKSIKRIAEIALSYAKAGAHMVAPSDMMDGRIHAIKQILFANNLQKVAVMSYSAKFSSSFYGPFREAAQSAPTFGDRKNYQLPMVGRGLAIRAARRDHEEGADLLMIKPAGPYLDIIRDIKNLNLGVPISCYHVSGEYAMLYHAANAGAFDLKTVVIETMKGFRRAGVDLIITYFTPRLLDWLKEPIKN